MKKTVFSFLVISLLMLAGIMPVSAEAVNPAMQNVGIVDVNKVVVESPKLKELQDQLNEKGNELSSQLEEDKANLSPEEFQAKQQAAYDEFMQIKQGMEKQFDELMQQALAEVAKERQLSVILYKNGVAYGGVDITKDVINKLQ
ncbi:MAG: OmpH family outer membrane protein [Pelosinus sp.]|nr:OmpH family outer membrane protein [Pelosinus sp.]